MDRRLIFDEPRRGSVDSPSMKCVEAKLQWKTFRDSDQWIAVCEPMGLTVHAETYAELTIAINETLGALENRKAQFAGISQMDVLTQKVKGMWYLVVLAVIVLGLGGWYVADKQSFKETLKMITGAINNLIG